jgi:hypothetical protein
MKLMDAIAVLPTAASAAVWSVNRRRFSLSAAILSLARSMDISPLYSWPVSRFTEAANADLHSARARTRSSNSRS